MNRTGLYILLGVAALVLWGSIFTVTETQYAIKFKLGKIISSDYQPGLHFKVPFINNVRWFDNRILTLDTPPEQMNTREQKYVDVDYFAKWRILDVNRFYTGTRGDEAVAASRLQQILRDGLRDEFAKRTLREVVSEQRAEIMTKLAEVANQRIDELGISIVDVRIKQISLTDRVTESVFNRMRTERTESANQLRSEGRESAEKIRSDADRQVQVIIAEAQRDAELVRGEGDARSTEIYAQAYEQDPEFYAFHRSLQAYEQAFRSNEDILVLDPGSEFFDYFRADSKQTQQ